MLSARRPSDKEETAGIVHLEKNSCCCAIKMERSYFDIWAFCFYPTLSRILFNLGMDAGAL